ncbi:flavodoxin family protein [Pedobacter sp.]
MKDIVVLLGSSKKDGDTRKAIHDLNAYLSFDVIDLSDYQIGHYDYEHKNSKDGFIPLIGRIVSYKILIFATPVYWYAMSGIMKVFFDRVTDLLDYEKDLGRELRGKDMAVLTSSVGDNLGDSFWLPFKETAKYLGINYVSGLHTLKGRDNNLQLQDFSKEIILKLNSLV